MNFINALIAKVDNFQRSHLIPSFLFAVVKKYGEDNGGYQSAIITYYGVLSLFPLLIVFTSLTELLLKNNQALRSKISIGVTHYFPVLGNQLQGAIHSPKKTGIALILSLLITFYGAKGGASAFQYAVTNLWHTPKIKQPDFIKNMLRSFGIMIGGGIGLILAATLSAYMAILGHVFFVKILGAIISAIMLWLTLILVFKLAAAGNKKVRDVLVGAAIAAVGLQILQTAGNMILAHELKGLNSEYGTFALVIGLLFWIYLQAQVILYAVEVDVVRRYHLYPRSITGELTDNDKHTYERSAKSHRQHIEEEVRVKFYDKTKK